jgi:hypothetical protein
VSDWLFVIVEYEDGKIEQKVKSDWKEREDRYCDTYVLIASTTVTLRAITEGFKMTKLRTISFRPDFFCGRDRRKNDHLQEKVG